MACTYRLVEAFALACELHADQKRKGTDIPYVTHLMATAALVGEYGGDENQIVAALLHDAVEDAGGLPILERIREAFGPLVAQYVSACSDAFSRPKPPWEERKRAFLSKIPQAAPEVRLIVAADKLHNARCTLNDLVEKGPQIWERFGGRRDGTLWYYNEIIAALGRGWDHPLLRQLSATVEELAHIV